jgi:hypothetical protein
MDVTNGTEQVRLRELNVCVRELNCQADRLERSDQTVSLCADDLDEDLLVHPLRDLVAVCDACFSRHLLRHVQLLLLIYVTLIPFCITLQPFCIALQPLHVTLLPFCIFCHIMNVVQSCDNAICSSGSHQQLKLDDSCTAAHCLSESQYSNWCLSSLMS